MLRGAVGKVMWVGRATVFLVGLAVIVALVVGLASAAFGANGQAWRLGQGNVATAITALGGSSGVNGPMVRLTNNNADANDTALDLRVQSGEAPMSVNSDTRVTNLNADRVDGVDSTGFLQNGAAAGGDLSGTYPNPQIANGAVAGGLGGKIADNTVNADDIATGGVDSSELNDDLDDTINADDIATGGVGSAEVANDSLSIVTDVQGVGTNQGVVFTGFTIPAQGCRIAAIPASVESADVGDLVVTEMQSGTLPDGGYIPAYVVTKEDTVERILCNATASDIVLDGSFAFLFHTVR